MVSSGVGGGLCDHLVLVKVLRVGWTCWKCVWKNSIDRTLRVGGQSSLPSLTRNNDDKEKPAGLCRQVLSMACKSSVVVFSLYTVLFSLEKSFTDDLICSSLGTAVGAPVCARPWAGHQACSVNNTDQECCGDHTAGPRSHSYFLVGKPGSRQRDNGGQGQML